MADSQDKTQLAEDRTDFAEDRTILANERTFAGWLRTGYAAIALGLAFNALFGRLEPVWIPKVIATAFLLIALVIFWTASGRVLAVYHRLHAHEIETTSRTSVLLIVGGSSLATVALGCAFWLLDIAPSR